MSGLLSACGRTAACEQPHQSPRRAVLVAALGDIIAGTPVKDGARGGRRIGRVHFFDLATGQAIRDDG